VDGSNPATEWHGLLSVDESPNLLNPKSGWLYNANNWPWSAAGPSSPNKESYPRYVENGSENARGAHAIRVHQERDQQEHARRVECRHAPGHQQKLEVHERRNRQPTFHAGGRRTHMERPPVS
jgi:acyl-homoserine lactone acylase PvdQ